MAEVNQTKHKSADQNLPTGEWACTFLSHCLLSSYCALKLNDRWDGRDDKAIPSLPLKEIVRVAATAPQASVAHLIHLLLLPHLFDPLSLLGVSLVLSVPADKRPNKPNYLDRV